MRSRYVVREPDAPHFVTCTVIEWLPVLTTGTRCELIVESLEFCRRQKGLRIYAWVILDNHLHAILSASDLPRVMAEFKSYTARRIIDHLVTDRCDWLLNQLQHFRLKHKSDSIHQLWQEGYHPQALTTDAATEQKMDYLHQNPVKRGLVAAAEHWRYSSAHEWLVGAVPVMRCDRLDGPAELGGQVRSQAELGNEGNKKKA
jgi:REP element-mobilizing transposase RayT